VASMLLFNLDGELDAEEVFVMYTRILETVRGAGTTTYTLTPETRGKVC